MHRNRTASAVRVECVVQRALAFTGSETITPDATIWTVRNAGFAVVGRIRVPLVAGAYTWCGARAVYAAALTCGYALLAIIQNESLSASANARHHAFTVLASIRTDRFAFAVDLVVAKFAHAHLGGETIGVLLALVRADGHANTLLGTPSLLTTADIRPGAVTAETAEITMRLASAGRHVALITVATVQDGDPTAAIRSAASRWMGNGIVR